MNEKPTYEELEQKIKRLEKEASQIKQTGDTPEVALSNMEQDELNSLFNLAIDMLCIADINGCFRSINKAWETNLGYSREDLLSKPYIDFVHPDDVESTLAEGQKLLQGQRSICFENRYRCKDGSYKWLAWTSSPHPETGITYAVARDITEKKRAETELCESEDRWRSFTENSPDHIMLLDKDYTIRFINHTVPDLTKEQVIGKSVFDFLPSDQHQEAIECFERVIQCSKPDRYETRYLTVNGETQYFDVRVSPLIVKSGSITGLLSTSNNITERKQAEEELKKHREHLEELVAGQTKDLQKVNERLQAEVTEHKQAEVELRKSKERFRVILDQTFQFIGLMTPDGILIEVNKTALNFSGIDEADVIGKPFWETPWWTHSKELQNKLQEAVKQASAGEFIRFEATHQDSGGKLHIVDFSVNPVKDEKGVVSLLIPEGRDITELKHIDEALRLERDKLKNLSDGLSQTSIGIDIVTKKYEVLYQNQVLMDRFGDLNGKRCYEEYLGLKEPCIECPMEKAIENNSIERIELTAPDGKCYELIAAPFQNPDGTIDKAIEVVMDITERKQVAEALEKSEERYRRLAENAKDMIYRMSLPDGIYEYVSPASNDIFGYSPEEWYNSSKLIQKIIHPDWHAYFKEQWENLIADNMPPVYEFQIIHKSGETKWIHQRNVMVHDDNGQAIAIEGIVTDITERKQAEEELQKLASVVRYSSELVNLATLDGKMIFLNNAGSKMLGIEPEEVGQANIMDVIPDHLVDLVQKDLLPSLMNNRTWEGDLQYRNIKTGKLTDVHAMTFSIQDSATGKPLYFANVSLDITDRKHTEVALQESQKRLTNFMDSSTDSFYLLDSDLNFVEVNRMGLMIIGKNKEEVIGKNIVDIVPDVKESGRYKKHLEVLRTGESFVIEDFVPHPVFGDRHFLMKSFKAGDGLGVTASDITELKQKEEELSKYREHLELLVKERTLELEQAQAELVAQEKFATIGKVAATVSHEIRNPLGTIRTSFYYITERIQDKILGIDRVLDRIDRNITRCDIIIEELLEYTRIRDLNKIKTSIDKWLKQELSQRVIPDNIKVIKDLSSGIEVMLDRERFQICFKNIIDNAVQALQGEMYDIDNDIHEKSLTVGSCVDGSRLIIEVKDSGPGIPLDDMEKIFEPLYSTKGFGVGLGLPIVKQIIEKHGGGVQVESKEKKGTTVTLWLPVNG